MLLVTMLQQGQFAAGHEVQEPRQLVVDCANGVGSVAVKRLTALLPTGLLRLVPCNQCAASTGRAADGVLNEACGSEYVQTTRAWPRNVQQCMRDSKVALCCSLDGDADRIICYTTPADAEQQSGGCVVLDGDYIAALVAGFVAKEVEQAHICDALSLGAVLAW
jgi:phosphoacetylglucosamine mutase